MVINDRNSLHKVALEVGMRVPLDPRTSNWDLYGNFELYCSMQIHSVLPHPTAHIDNAKLIASLSEEEVQSISRNKLLQMGFVVGTGK